MLKRTIRCCILEVHWYLMNYFAIDAEIMCMQPAVTLRGTHGTVGLSLFPQPLNGPLGILLFCHDCNENV